jgi:hypothetical protein
LSVAAAAVAELTLQPLTYFLLVALAAEPQLKTFLVLPPLEQCLSQSGRVVAAEVVVVSAVPEEHHLLVLIAPQVAEVEGNQIMIIPAQLSLAGHTGPVV